MGQLALPAVYALFIAQVEIKQRDSSHDNSN